MSTYDVPGFNPANHDELAMGCWAEHDDGSLIFVESTELNRVIYSMFDISKDMPVEYRDAMPESSFKRTFSWKAKSSKEKWTWHDKTPFPWDRIIKGGGQDGLRLPSARHIMTAAERVAESLRLKGATIAKDFYSHRTAQVRKRAGVIWDKISRAVGELRK